MPSVRVAERAGVGLDGAARPTEDRVLRLPDAVVVLDGATALEPMPYGPGWYVDQLGGELARGLAASDPLPDLLGAAIRSVASRYGLRRGYSPTSTVAILRWCESYVDVLALADSPVVLFGSSGVEVISDDRLIGLRDTGLLRGAADVPRLRNVDGGFWVAGAEPSAAWRAVCVRRPLASVRAALVCTDGVAVGVTEYGLFSWGEALELAARSGPEAVLERVRAAERSDLSRTRWPRGKVHDDQAMALVSF
jgi:hypothetical protein